MLSLILLSLLTATQPVTGDAPVAAAPLHLKSLVGVGRTSLEGRVRRIRHCASGDVRIWAVQHDSSALFADIATGPNSGFVAKSALMGLHSELVGALCAPRPALVLSRDEGREILTLLIRPDGFQEEGTRTSSEGRRSLLGLLPMLGGFLAYGGDGLGQAGVTMVENGSKSFRWYALPSVKGVAVDLYPGASGDSWLGTTTVPVRGDAGTWAAFSLSTDLRKGPPSGRLMGDYLPGVLNAATCGRGCLVTALAAGLAQPGRQARLFREPGIARSLPMKDAPSDVTSTIPVMVGSSLCLLDTTLDSIGCRGGNRVLIAREGEYLVGPPAIEAAEGVLYLRIVVGSAAGNRGRESLLASVELRLVKP